MGNSEIKIVFVVDVRNWAFDNIALSLKSKLADKFLIDIIYWEDFPSTSSFLTKIDEIHPDCVHFFFREQLSMIFSNTDVSSNLLQRFCKRAVTTHVPDYLYSDDLSLMNRRGLLSFVDSYFATNSDLFEMYKRSPFVPDPWGVIYDWINLEPTTKPHKVPSEKFRIVWSGNSLWGEYAGHVDYKGLKTIIIPAIARLGEKHNSFEFVCLDSSKEKIANHQVLEEMHRADILIVASEKEGTPLTLIEGMANGCAIVSTNVGIASEILPEEQIEFIYNRSSQELYSKLDQLISHPEIIPELGLKNHEAWQKIFGSDGDLRDKWCEFINSAVRRYKAEGSSRKIDLLPKKVNVLRSRTLSIVRRTGVIVKKLGMVNTLNRISPQFATVYHRLVHGNHADLDYSVIEGLYESVVSSIKAPDPIVIAAPFWKGVGASTQAVFPDSYLQYPFTEREYPEVTDHVYLERMSELLAKAAAEVVIYSGGSLLHKKLARLVRHRSQNKRQYLMWHGSPAQWVDPNQLRFFSAWRGEYDNGVINGMICLKRNLDDTLNCMGIRSFYLMNPVPRIDDTRLPNKLRHRVNIGLFSSISSWAKNPFPQLLSVAGLNNASLTTNISQDDVKLAFPDFDKVNYIRHMDRSEFLKVLKNQDINLYVTNTECSPMIALESWACLIPCIVGPAGDVYSPIDEKLGYYLVEKNVDSAASIANRINMVIENYDEIVGLLEINRSEQRQNFENAKKLILHNL